MDDGVSEDILTSEKGQSIQVKKLIPQVEKLRRESLPMSPLSLNGSLTNVDVCDTSFGKKVIKEMSSTNAEIPDESFSEEIFVNDTKCKKKSESTPNADMSSTSFSEELLQDMEYGLDALRDAVPVLCLKKNEESEDADIFEEMSAFQVMGIFNNKNSNRTAKSFNRKHEDQENELKNKRYFPDKNIDVLYKNEENKNPKSSEKLECTKLPGKKIGKCDDEVSDSMQDDETDINNNDNECSMESSETSANEYDWVQKIMLAGDDGDPNNNCQGNETPEGDCKMEESEEDDKELSTDQNHIKIKVKENNESESEEFIQPLLLSGNVVVNKDSCLNRNESEKKTIKDAMELDEHEDKCTESFRGTDQGELSDTSVINNLNDTMRNINEPNNCKTVTEEECGTVIGANLEHDPLGLKCSSCDFISPKKILLQQHHVFYHDKWLFECSECNSGYNTKGAFERHKLTHLECKIRKRKFKCSRCSQTFFFRLSLQKHLKNHKYKEENMKLLQQRRPKQKKKNTFLY